MSNASILSKISLVYSFIFCNFLYKRLPVQSYNKIQFYRVFSHDVTAAILVSQNMKTAAMLVFQTNPVGVELFSYANAFFCSNKFP